MGFRSPINKERSWPIMRFSNDPPSTSRLTELAAILAAGLLRWSRLQASLIEPSPPPATCLDLAPEPRLTDHTGSQT